jgi:hypothetical protein
MPADALGAPVPPRGRGTPRRSKSRASCSQLTPAARRSKISTTKPVVAGVDPPALGLRVDVSKRRDAARLAPLARRLVLAAQAALAALPVLLGREEGLQAREQIAHRRAEVEQLPARGDRQLHAGALERAEHLAALAQVLRAREAVLVDDHDDVELARAHVGEQLGEAVALLEVPGLRRLAVVDVGADELPAARGDERRQRRELRGDGVLVALAERGDAGVDGGDELGRIDHAPLASAA